MQFVARSVSKSIRTIRQSSWVHLSQQFLSTSASAAKPVDSSSEWSRPTEIPYQPKIANSVDLIGYVHQNVQFNAVDGGNSWAGTVISHGPSSSSESDTPSADTTPYKFWIPVIFQGALAHTAECHLKKNDRVHITGQVLVDQGFVQVMVAELHYVDAGPTSKPAPKVSPTEDKEDVIKHSASLSKKDFGKSIWFDILDNPGDWRDYRQSKQNGLVNPRFPDFKKKNGTISLWLNTAPIEILSDLKDLKCDTPASPKQPKAGNGEAWKDLVENMNKWYDNRVDKRHPKGPDFKHRETGAGLWLIDSPSWVLEKLPPPKEQTNN